MNIDKANNSDSSKNTQIVEREQIEGTPFTIIKHEEAWFLTLGKYRLTNGMSKEEVMNEINNTSWERIMQIIQIMIDENAAVNAEKKNLAQQTKTVKK